MLISLIYCFSTNFDIAVQFLVCRDFPCHFFFRPKIVFIFPRNMGFLNVLFLLDCIFISLENVTNIILCNMWRFPLFVKYKEVCVHKRAYILAQDY